LEIQKIVGHLSEDELSKCLDFIKGIEEKEISHLEDMDAINEIFKEDANLLRRLADGPDSA